MTHCFFPFTTDMHSLYLIQKTAILKEEQGPLGLQRSGMQLNPHISSLLATIQLQSCSHQQGITFLNQTAWFEDGEILEGATIQLTKRGKDISTGKCSSDEENFNLGSSDISFKP